MSISGHLVVINEEVWNSISTGDQAIMLEEAAIAGKNYMDNIEKAEEAAGEAIIKAGGQILEFPAAELAKWKAAAPDLLGDWVANMDERGMGDQAKEVQAYWLNIINN
jgi:TRAP-type C4-dicarboxylate transport system substrate-binding protein